MGEGKGANHKSRPTCQVLRTQPNSHVDKRGDCASAPAPCQRRANARGVALEASVSRKTGATCKTSLIQEAT